VRIKDNRKNIRVSLEIPVEITTETDKARYKVVRFCWEIWRQVPECKKALARGDWTAIEEGILDLARLMATEIMAGCPVWYLEQEDTRLLGKKLAGKQKAWNKRLLSCSGKAWFCT